MIKIQHGGKICKRERVKITGKNACCIVLNQEVEGEIFI